MKACFKNDQMFDIGGRWTVQQRRMAWQLLVHPKKYWTKGGMRWALHWRPTTSQEEQELVSRAIWQLLQRTAQLKKEI